MNSKSSLFFFFVYLLTIIEPGLAEDSDDKPNVAARISRGVLASPDQFPFVVYIRIYSSPTTGKKCTGSIMNTNWVLTAAHCFTISKPELPIKLTAGVVDVDSYDEKHSQERTSAEIIQHETVGSMRVDVALVRVDKPFEFNDHVKAITLIEAKLKDDVTCDMIGFGDIETGYNSKLFYMAGHPVSCTSSSPARGDQNTDATLCMTGVKPSNAPCQGDSGGPLLCAGKLAGLLRGRINEDKATKCAEDTEISSLYMSTLHYGAWIKERMGTKGASARGIPISRDKKSSAAWTNNGVGFITLALTLYLSVHNNV